MITYNLIINVTWKKIFEGFDVRRKKIIIQYQYGTFLNFRKGFRGQLSVRCSLALTATLAAKP